MSDGMEIFLWFYASRQLNDNKNILIECHDDFLNVNT